MAKADVGVSILCWKKYGDSVACIDSLLQSTHNIQKIVVTDNASNDGSLEKLKEKYSNMQNIVFIENRDNLGFAKGMNVGIRILLDSDCEYILPLNQDTVMAPDMIDECLRAVKTNPEMTIIGPRIYYANPPNKIWHGGAYFSLIKSGIVNPEKNRFDSQCDNHPREVTFLTACAILVHRKVFAHIGSFDEDYFFYSEDLDFCYRAKSAGHKMWYVPSAKVWHNISGIAKDRTGDFALYNMAMSNIIFLRKNFPKVYTAYGIMIQLLLFSPFRMLQICRGSKSLKAAFAWFKGTWHGLRKPLRSCKKML